MISTWKYLIGLLSLLSLSGCIGFQASTIEAEQETDKRSFCEALAEHDDWLEAAVAVERRWKLPLYISLAELNMPLGTEASRYITPLESDWQAYRIATENWQANPASIATALDFLGWHAEWAAQRNQLSREQAGDLFLAVQLGHGGYHRLQYQPQPALQQQAALVDQRAARYRQQLQQQCPDIRQQADSFFQWPW